LIIDDDPSFAAILLAMAREKGFKGVVALRGDIGLSLANELQPSAITLDVKLPVLDGWSVLGRLKKNPRTRHIPVGVISVVDHREQGEAAHAFTYLDKPVTREAIEDALLLFQQFLDRKVRRLLVVEADEVERRAMIELVGEGDDLEVFAASSVEAALEEAARTHFDCAIVGLGPSDHEIASSLDRLRRGGRAGELPIILHTSRDLTRRDEIRLRKIVRAVIPKAAPGAAARLLEQTSLFLHRSDERLPARTRQLLESTREKQPAFDGKKVLVVDDDVRNIFALTSVLESNQMQVVYAENGRAGIEALRKSPKIDLVLMDVMMPEMDGYETMERIRKDPAFADLPIIAVTAKALRDDRERCVAAGASDYIPKPVDPERLMQLIRMWLT
jgi:CheY-like chemotaxis protein